MGIEEFWCLYIHAWKNAVGVGMWQEFFIVDK